MDILLDKIFKGQQTEEFAAFFVTKKSHINLFLFTKKIIYLLISAYQENLLITSFCLQTSLIFTYF